MIDNTLGQNDMTGTPGPDMAAAGTVPVEVDPSTGQLTQASKVVKSLSPVSAGSATNAGTTASATIPPGMQANNYMKTEEQKAIESAMANAPSTNTIT